MAAARLARACAVGALLLMPGLAGADIKAGADAWARGDYTAAVQEWKGPAASGDADAQFDLGQAYRSGRGVPRDLAKAEQLFAKAAAQGHIQAADNYGLLLFDRGERTQAMPYVRAAADRGDPRAQYLLAIAHFNGDLAAKDWIRAYALMTLAQGAGLTQAAPAMAQMDQLIPLAQRQAAAKLAAELSQKAEANRTSQLVAGDLGESATPAAARPAAAISTAVRTAGTASPASAGADYARPAIAATPKPPVAKPTVAAAFVQKPSAPAPSPKAAGNWRVQLGAFGVTANADALWAKAKARPELAGHGRLNVKAGAVTKLQAGGFASREAANAACSALDKSGFTCIPTQD